MGFLSKEECCFCGEKAGLLGRKKMQDKEYICKDCEENCSVYFDPSAYTKPEVQEHMEYMKKQDILYKKEFETLPEEKKEKFMYQFDGIVFADDIAMFELIDPKMKKRNFKELFRYDQVADFERYAERNTDDSDKEFKEIGVLIKMRCSRGIGGVGMRDEEKERAHPYLEEVKLPCEKNTNNQYSGANRLMDKLNAIYLRESDNKSIGQSIKESFTGTAKQKRDAEQAKDLFKGLAKFAKAKMDGDENAVSEATAGLQGSAVSAMNNACGNQQVHKELADAAEQRAWG